MKLIQLTNIVNRVDFKNNFRFLRRNLIPVLAVIILNSFMKNLLNAIPFIFAFIIFAGCDKNEFSSEKDLKIEFGYECGWCAGEELITVSPNEISYIRNIPCGEEKGTTRKSRDISSEEWDEILSSFDYSVFITLNYSECNVCADGCDEIIKITQIKSTHELRYSTDDTLEGMQFLRQILKAKLEEMR